MTTYNTTDSKGPTTPPEENAMLTIKYDPTGRDLKEPHECLGFTKLKAKKVRKTAFYRWMRKGELIGGENMTLAGAHGVYCTDAIGPPHDGPAWRIWLFCMVMYEPHDLELYRIYPVGDVYRGSSDIAAEYVVKEYKRGECVARAKGTELLEVAPTLNYNLDEERRQLEARECINWRKICS